MDDKQIRDRIAAAIVVYTPPPANAMRRFTQNSLWRDKIKANQANHRKTSPEKVNAAKAMYRSMPKLFDKTTPWTEDELMFLFSEEARGMTHKQIGAVLGRTLISVESQMRRLRRVGFPLKARRGRR